MNTTAQVSGVLQVNVTPYVNCMSHVNAMHQVHTSPVPVEDSSAIMIGSELLNSIPTVPAGAKFSYPITEPRHSITNYNHVWEEKVQAYEISKHFIATPLDNAEGTDDVVTGNRQTVDGQTYDG